jgi:RNA polymerase sigma-70 factor (ECF subfamily)
MEMTTEAIVAGPVGAPALEPDLNSPAVLQELRDGLLYLIRRQVDDPAIADDVCNEAIRIVLDRVRRRRLEDPTKAAAYLAQTARNLLKADRRKALRRRTVTGAQKAIVEFPDPAGDASVAMHAQFHALAVHAVLKRMPIVRDRELLVRFYLHEEDKVDICRDLHLTPEHFDRVMSRARERFRERLCRQYRQSDLI